MSVKSKEEYQQIFSDYAEDEKNESSRKVIRTCFDRELVYAADILNVKRDMEDTIEVLSDLIINEFTKNSTQYKYLINYRNYLLHFYSWAILNNYFQWQPFDSNFLSAKILLHKAVQKMELVFFDDTQVDLLCGRLETNKELYEVIIRGFYEGIPDAETLYEIRCSDIDFEEGSIRLGNYDRLFSDKFMGALRRYLDIHQIEIERSNGRNYSLPLETVDYRLMKGIVRKNSNFTLQNFRKNLTMYFVKISQCAQTRVNVEILYKCGFIHYVYERCDEDRARFVELFVDVINIRSNRIIGRVLEEYADDYHLNQSESKYIRRDYCVLAMKSSYLSE